MTQNGDFISKVLANYEQFTKAELKVADFILKHSQEVLFMSITDLADACKVGETTVFRFCKTMRLRGYQEFKIQLSLGINENSVSGDETADRAENRSFSQKLLEASCNVLRETDTLLNEQKLSEILEHMISARRLLFLGVGSSGLIAMLAANKFLRLTDKVQCFTDSHMQAMTASLLHPGDMAIVISYSGSTKDSIANAKLVREAGAYVTVITHFLKSPLTSYADSFLLCGSKEGPLEGSSTTAIISQLYLLEVLYSEYYRRTFEESSCNNQKSAEAIVDKMV